MNITNFFALNVTKIYFLSKLLTIKFNLDVGEINEWD